MALDLIATFEKYEDEHLHFERIEKPLNPRPDICAYLLLDSIVTPEDNYMGRKNDMVCSASHDQIWVDVDVEQLANNATEEQIRDLYRCGFFYDEETDSITSFV